MLISIFLTANKIWCSLSNNVWDSPRYIGLRNSYRVFKTKDKWRWWWYDNAWRNKGIIKTSQTLFWLYGIFDMVMVWRSEECSNCEWCSFLSTLKRVFLSIRLLQSPALQSPLLLSNLLWWKCGTADKKVVCCIKISYGK